MARRILRWTLPIDDQPHEIGGGPVLLVEKRHRVAFNEVEVWTNELLDEGWPTTEPLTPKRQAQVIGTGHPFPDDWLDLGSTLDGTLVWHVMEIPS